MITSIRGAALALAATIALSSATAAAATFDTNFESVNTGATATDFVVPDGTLSVEFRGGTARTVGVGALYRSGDVSWMLEPDAVNGSDGTAEAILSEPALEVTLYAIKEPTASARVEFLAGVTVVADFTVGNSFQEMSHSVATGGAPIDQVVVTHDGAAGMVAVDDFSFSTDIGGLSGGGGGSDSNALGAWTLAALGLGLVAALRRRVRRR